MNKNLRLKSAWRKFIEMNGSGVLLALIVFIILVSIIAPHITGGKYLTWKNIIQVFRQQTYIGIIACGMTFVIISGNIDLSVGSQLTLLTVLCANLSLQSNFLAIVGTLFLGLVLGVFNGFFVSGLKLNPFIVTLGTGSIYGALAMILTSGFTKRADSILFDYIGTGSVFGLIPMPVLIMLAVVLVFSFISKRTVFGQRLYAIGANPKAARYSGIRSRRTVAITYVLSGFCCALAAIVLIARSTSANPAVAGGKEMDVILAVVLGGTSILGGKGSIWGTVIGFLFIGFMSNGFTFLNFNQYMQWEVMGVILVSALAIDVYKQKGGSIWKRKQS